MAVALGVIVGFLSARQDWALARSLEAGFDSTAAVVQLARNAGFGSRPLGVGDHQLGRHAGVTVYAAEALAPGFTIAATGGPEVTLFDAKGAVSRGWRVPVESLFTIPALMRAEDVSIDGYQLLPDGSLLALVLSEADFPAFQWRDTVMNTVLVKIDAHSRLIWAYYGNPHHEVVTTPSGQIYVLVARGDAMPPRADLGLPPNYRDEGIAVLDSAGHEQRVIWLDDALARSPYAGLFGMLDQGQHGCLRSEYYCWDLFHANSIKIVPAEIAAQVGVARPGDLLINLRAFDTALIVDPETGTVRWALHGTWRHGHDATFTRAGTLTLFDNLGNIGGIAPSRVLEVDPATGATLWQYDGGKTHPFYSSVRGTAEVLKNGNVLITESMGGRIFEVTRSGAIAWEYVSPPAHDAEFPPILWGARRIDPADFPFLGPSGLAQQ